VTGVNDKPSDWESRISRLEEQVHDLRTRADRTAADAAAARILAGAADRDVSEFKTEMREFRDHNTQLINALSDQVNGRIDRLEDKVDQGFVEMRGKFDQLAGGQQHIVELLTRALGNDGEART
jgi:predicted  nucleic acid-binding Zn-ribbon protein